MTDLQPGDIIRLIRPSNTVWKFVGKLYRVITVQEYAEMLYNGAEVSSLPPSVTQPQNLVAVTIQPDNHGKHRYHFLEKDAVEKIA